MNISATVGCTHVLSFGRQKRKLPPVGLQREILLSDSRRVCFFEDETTEMCFFSLSFLCSSLLPSHWSHTLASARHLSLAVWGPRGRSQHWAAAVKQHVKNPGRQLDGERARGRPPAQLFSRILPPLVLSVLSLCPTAACCRPCACQRVVAVTPGCHAR